MTDRHDCLDLLEFAPIDLSRVRKSQGELDTEALPRWVEVQAWLGEDCPYLAGEVYGLVRRRPELLATQIGQDLMAHLDQCQTAELEVLRGLVAKYAPTVPWYWQLDQQETLAYIPHMSYFQLVDMIGHYPPPHLKTALVRHHEVWLRFRGY